MKDRKLLIFASLFFSWMVHAELQTVSHVDINRYLGTWQEIARFENKHQEGCIEGSAFYSMTKNHLSIKNTCVKVDGSTKEALGRGRIVDASSNAKLQVNFTPWFIKMWGAGWGDYWIIELDDNYQYAVVSEPKMERLWIISRKPMSKTLYSDITNRLSAKGFAIDKLVLNRNALVE